MSVCEFREDEIEILEKMEAKINSLSLKFEFGGIKMYLQVSTRVFRLIFRVLNVPKGLGAGLHQRGRLWTLKHEVLGLWKVVCIRNFGAAYTCMLSVSACIPRNPNFDSSDDPTSNGHISLNINPNQSKFVFKLNSKMSNFQ